MDSWALGKLKKSEEIKAFVDIYNSPTYVNDLCLGVKKVLGEDISGTFHLAGPTRMNRYEFLKILADSFGYDQKLIIPAESSSIEGDISRPKDTSLLSTVLANRLDMQFSNIERGLKSLWEASRNF